MGRILTCLILICTGAAAMAAGQAVGLKHPVLDHQLNPSQVEGLRAATAPILAMSDEQILAFIPPHGYVQYVECPNCYGGVEGNGVLTWSIQRPEELKCRFCGTVAYPNPKYPETKTLTGKNMLGEEVTYPYHYDEAHQAPHYFSAHLWMHKRAWLMARMLDLAKLHALTGKPEYARPVVVALDGFAKAYPHYPVIQTLPRRVSFREQKAPWHWDSGRWNYFHNEVPVELIPTYDLVYDSPVFDELSRQRGYDLRERIEKDFLKATVEGVWADKNLPVMNVVGYSIRSAALLGRVIAEPRFVHWAWAEMAKHVDQGFYPDGMWNEGTPSYHAMTVGGLVYAFDAVRGYSDPAGYTDPVDGRRFDDLQPETELPFWGRCRNAPEIIAMPDGVSAVVHDTHPYEHRHKPREASFSTIMPAFGHASLGRGTQANQMLAQLHFSGGYGHQHGDTLNLMLWAKERELLPDVGYTWTQMRHWATSTLAHNLVVVDRQEQSSGGTGGNLLLYYPGDPKQADSLGLSAVEACGERAYARVKGLDLYRRLVVMIPVSADDAYVVDIFRVRGGNTHDWTLNGDADRDTVAACSVPLSGSRKWLLEEGEEWKEPTTEAHSYNPYGMVRDVQSGPCQGDLQLTMTGADDATRGVKSWISAGGPSEVLLGRSPSVRRMGVGSNADMRKGYDFWMPKLLARRRGDEPLTSLFAAVHEPFAGSGFIKSVKRLKLTPDDGLAVGLQVERAGGTDTIISAAPDGEGKTYRTDTGVSLTGRLGVVRLNQGKLVGAWLLDGTSLNGTNWAISTATARLEGDIVAATRQADGAKEDTFVTTAAVPEGAVLAGRWLIVTYPGDITQGYEIKSVRREPGRTVLILTDDPAVRLNGDTAEEVYHPRRKFQGPCRFAIGGVAALYARPNGAYQTDMTAPTEFTLPK